MLLLNLLLVIVVLIKTIHRIFIDNFRLYLWIFFILFSLELVWCCVKFHLKILYFLSTFFIFFAILIYQLVKLVIFFFSVIEFMFSFYICVIVILRIVVSFNTWSQCLSLILVVLINYILLWEILLLLWVLKSIMIVNVLSISE